MTTTTDARIDTALSTLDPAFATEARPFVIADLADVLGHDATGRPRPEDIENLIADLADAAHTLRVHTTSGTPGPCHGDNDGCQGGPDSPDHEVADEALIVLGRGLGMDLGAILDQE